jgi:hypothetical protein
MHGMQYRRASSGEVGQSHALNSKLAFLPQATAAAANKKCWGSSRKRSQFVFPEICIPVAMATVYKQG